MTLRSHLSPLRAPGFRWFFCGQVVNTAGSSMAGIALIFAVLAIDRSALAVGLVAAAWTVPMVGFMLIGGAIADRLPRVLLLRACNLLQALTQGIAATLVLTGEAEVWHLVVLQFVSGTAFAISYPAFHGMVPILLPERERKSAYLLISQSESSLRIGGPAVAGILVATAGPGWGLAVDAVTFLVAALFLALVRLPFSERPERSPSVIGDFVAGWSYSCALGWVLPIACCSLVFNALISGPIGVLGPVMAADTIGSQGWGFARSGEAVGMLLATLVLVRVTFRRPLRTCVLGFSLYAVPMLALAFWLRTGPLVVAFLIAGAGLSIINLAWNLTVQQKVREDMLSRVMAIDGFFSFVAMPLGEVLVGPLAHAFGARAVQLGGVAVCLIVTLIGLTRPSIRDLRLDPVG